jgi:hypothetical protein
MTFVKRIVGATVLGAALLTSPILSSAQAGYVATLHQVGADVVATGSGPIDLTGLTPGLTFNDSPVIDAFAGEIKVGAIQPIRQYHGITGPTNFGSGGGLQANSGSGDLVGIAESVGLLFVSRDYVSGDPLSGHATWLNQTFTSLGVTPGTYEWTWGTGPDQNFTLVIPAAVPEPASAMLLGTALAGLLLAGTIRRT